MKTRGVARRELSRRHVRNRGLCGARVLAGISQDGWGGLANVEERKRPERKLRVEENYEEGWSKMEIRVETGESTWSTGVVSVRTRCKWSQAARAVAYYKRFPTLCGGLVRSVLGTSEKPRLSLRIPRIV